MPVTAAPPQERRRFVRTEPPSGFAVNLLQPHRSVAANSINVSSGGLCLRLEETLEVRSLIRLQLTPSRSEGSGRSADGRPVTCVGRVSWVIQRLDLRDGPPFLFDVGIEFVDPPPLLRQLMAQQGIRSGSTRPRPARGRVLESCEIRSRQYVPRLERVGGPLRWHLVVSVDGVPCFSQRYRSERAALVAWGRFKRQQAHR